MTRCASTRTCWSATAVALTLLLAAASASAQTPPPDQQTPPDKNQPAAAAPPEGRMVSMGPTREIKLADNTWFRFGAQVQAWARGAQDRIKQPDGSDGGFAIDFYCRRCRFFVTGSVVKNVTFNILLEAGNLGRGDNSGNRTFVAPSVLDAYAQVKFADFFLLSGGSILMPLSRNGMQPTTTYLSIDNANIDITPVLQGNSNVLRDLGFQANGFFLEDHLEYRVGVFQGSRAGSIPTASGSHNPPRLITSLQYNFWDTEKGYVNGGHYYGAKKTVGLFAGFDYQTYRKADPPFAGVAKNAYYGLDAAVFINYPLSGVADPKNGGDELVGLLEASYHDGGYGIPVAPVAGQPPPAAPTPGTYSNVLQQFNFLAEGAYYNRDLKMSFFGKFEMRQISGDYSPAVKSASNIYWAAVGLKYYIAPANLMNLGLQYERVQYPDALPTAQSGTNNLTLQMQLILY